MPCRVDGVPHAIESFGNLPVELTILVDHAPHGPFDASNLIYFRDPHQFNADHALSVWAIDSHRRLWLQQAAPALLPPHARLTRRVITSSLCLS
jgi:hypothetical protein